MIATPNFGFAADVQDDDALLAQFEGDTQESGGIPYMQVLTFPNLSIKDIKSSRPWGLFIPAEQADAVGFKPDANWTQATYTIEGDNGSEDIEVEGWVAHSANLVVLHRSDKEVQARNSFGWGFFGLEYEKGNLTQAGEILAENRRDENDRPTHRRIVRFLVMLLGNDGKFMHEAPLALTARGGFGGAFGVELREFYKDLDGAYGAASGKRSQRLNAFAQAFSVFSVEFDLYKKDKNTAPFLVPSVRIAPVAKPDKVGQSWEVPRQDRKVKLIGCKLNQVLIPKASELGQVIGELYQQYEDFPKPNRGREMNQSQAAATFDDVVKIDPASVNFLPTGNVEAIYYNDDLSQKVVLSPSLSWVIDTPETEFRLQGPIVAGVVVVETARAIGGAAPAPEPQLATVGAGAGQTELDW